MNQTDNNTVDEKTDRARFTSPSSSVFPVYGKQQFAIKEEVFTECSLDHENHRLLHIKEEEEEHWTSREGEQVHGLQEAHITRFLFTTESVKSEDDEDKQQLSHLESQTEESREVEPPAGSSATQIKPETDGEDCGGSELVRNHDPNSHPQSHTDENTSDSSETDASDDWHQPLPDNGQEPEDTATVLKCRESSISDVGCNGVKKPLSCFECGEDIDYKGSLQRHRACHLTIRSSSCFGDDKCDGVEKKVDSGIRICSVVKPFCCCNCGTSFSLKSNLRRHMRVHTGEKPFGCDVCGKRFTQQGTLKKHTRVHTGEKPFGCDVCGKRFRQQGILKRHTRVHTRQQQFSCEVFGEKITSQSTHTSYMSFHTKEKHFGCSDCGKRFTKPGKLKRHMSVHTGEKPFDCNVCGKRFTEQGKVKRHMRIHTGEKPSGCDVCGKRFTVQDSLRRHMRVHTGEKPFDCDVCGKRFAVRSSMKRHMRVHRGERPSIQDRTVQLQS